MDESIFYFNVGAIVVLLIITLVSALLPIYVTRGSSNSPLKEMIVSKLPFLTAGVFLGAGLLHLLPDAVKTFHKAQGTSEYPWMYLCAAIGSSLVWFVDLMNMGSSERMMAIAAAAAPGGGASMCRVRIPTIATYGFHRSRSLTPKEGSNFTLLPAKYGSCDCIVPESPSHVLLSRISRAGASKMLLRDRVGSNTFAIDELLGELDDPEASHSHVDSATSRHIVFSGENSLIPFLLAALFSVHSLIAGFALGVNPSLTKTAIATYAAILSHKFIEAMSVGANFAKEKVEMSKSVAVIVIYSIMTPLGIVLGMVLTASLQGPSVLFAESIAMSIGSGSFIYLAYHEMSEDDDSGAVSVQEKIVLYLLGLFAMAALAYWL